MFTFEKCFTSDGIEIEGNEVKEKQLDAEIMQMWDGNPYNNEIRNV